MRIGVNSRLFQYAETGIPHYIKSLYSQLQKSSRHTVTFYQTDDTKKLGTTRVYPVRNSLIRNILFDLYHVTKLVKKNIDIYHAPSHVLPLFKNKSTAYVVSIMDLSFLKVPHFSGRLFNMYYSYIVGKSIKSADAVIAISANTKKDIIEQYGIAEDKISVIYLGVDDIYFQNNKQKRIVDEPYFFSITTHPKRKNIYGILQAMAVSKGVSHLKFVLAGHIDAEPLQELQDYIRKNNLQDRVEFRGFVTQTELVSLYQHAEFFIYPSFYEGFGFPPVEAMACGCPVIVSNTSSLPEVVPNSDWLINPYSIDEIAQTMDKMTTLKPIERKKLIAQNLTFVQKFRWDTTAQMTLSLFKSCLRKI